MRQELQRILVLEPVAVEQDFALVVADLVLNPLVDPGRVKAQPFA